jgi:hypothetical protein
MTKDTEIILAAQERLASFVNRTQMEGQANLNEDAES